MTIKGAAPIDPSDLRRLAEDLLRGKPADLSAVPPEEAGRLLHELQVHQVELELQNEELRRAQLEIEASRVKYFDLYDLAPVGYLTVGENGLIIEANLRAAELLGVERNRLIRQPMFRFIVPEDQAVYYLQRKRLHETGALQVCEVRIYRKGGSPFWGRLETGTAARGGEDMSPVCLIVLSDVTERRKAQDEIARYSEELKRSNEELQRFAYVASHDLQEPLRTIASFLQLIEKRNRDLLDADSREFISYAVSGANRLKIMIDNLLEYSRLGSSGNPFVHVESGDILRKVIDVFGSEIERSNAVITFGDLPAVMADPDQLGRLFQNLVGNALKFHGEAPPRIQVEARLEGMDWVFSVSDNGIGIDPRYKDRIFVIFQRLHTMEKFPGTGIGLSICKKIVERYGGRIWVESEPGKGSAFFFTIPAKEAGAYGTA
jgi:chemotaxis family two-component system sensor kinase Cph1